MQAVVIHPGAPPVVVEVDPTLEGYQGIVGGWIEAVGLRSPVLATAYINEEGKLEGLAPNVAATAISHLMAGDFIAGPMVVLGPPDDEGNDTPVTPEILTWLGLEAS